MTKITSKITPFLWFDDNAEEAMNFYISIFKNSKVLDTRTYHNSGPNENEDIFTCSFELDGTKFMAMSAGPQFKFNEAISLYVDCVDQAEVDYFWEKLTADGGAESQCGWLRDKFGLSWQIVPRRLDELMNDPDPIKAGRVMHAMMQMVKLDVAKLEEAYEGN
jgi:predicted 3-demethylubiquinone-9 3-methyltransferase (glyoxalase superfamily)